MGIALSGQAVLHQSSPLKKIKLTIVLKNKKEVEIEFIEAKGQNPMSGRPSRIIFCHPPKPLNTTTLSTRQRISLAVAVAVVESSAVNKPQTKKNHIAFHLISNFIFISHFIWVSFGFFPATKQPRFGSNLDSESGAFFLFPLVSFRFTLL